ncbi:3-oxoacyl-[acyl-carrier-protein] synthase III C-terminal domain-containing protein [Streptomyces erythrochromogenes]|uniref:3-oxoacyl-ACP synthase III family protein n=1 Tax=Streptomyces erythrochromogenes TaxID=285574 RepID=UPI0034276268
MTAATVRLADVSGYLPGEPVPAGYYTDYPGAEDRLRNSPMFKIPSARHHVADGESNTDLVERAVQPLLERQGRDAIRAVDVLLVHSQLPDIPFVGAAGEIAHRLGLRPRWMLDVANGGCASFVHLLELARQILTTTDARTALLCNAQTAAGQLFTQDRVRGLAHAAIPGDGCGVAYLTTGAQGSPVLGLRTRHIPQNAGEMTLVRDDGRRYWEAGQAQPRIGFTESGVTKVLDRGNRLVPEVVRDLCRDLGKDSADIDVLVTNQPNRLFLESWRQALGLPPERHPDTFDRYGNLFGAAMPITLDHAVREGTVPQGGLVVLGGFAHAGDYAAAAAIRWQGRA